MARDNDNLNQIPAEESDSTKQDDVEVKDNDVLPDDFFWDSIVQYLASGMIALTLLGQAAVALVEVTSGTVKCFTLNENFTREQNFYVNDYCDRYAPTTQYLSWVLILQALAVVVPHFLWKSWYKGKFRFFFELARSLDRDRNSRSGQYDLKNFKKMRSLREEFGGRSKPIPWMFVTYVLKLFIQLFFVIAAFPIHATEFAFDRYQPSFFCPPKAQDEQLCTKLRSNDSCSIDISDWPFDFQVYCVIASLSTQSVVWVVNMVVLICTTLALTIGLIWCFMRHSQYLNWKQAALFSFESSLNADHFVAKPLWNTLRRPKLYRISNEFKFLFMKLQWFDAGLAKVLRELVIDDLVERMIIKNNEEQNYIGASNFSRNQDLDEVNRHQEERRIDRERKNANSKLYMTMRSFIRRFIWHPRILRHSRKVFALDLSFGSPAGFAYPLAERASHVASFMFDHHYENPKKPVTCNKFLNSCIYRLKAQSSLFGLPSEQALKFDETFVPLYIRAFQGRIVAHYKINVIIIGPLTAADEDRIVTIHELLNFLDISSPRLLATGALLVTLKPTAIEGDTPKQFIDFTPTKRIWKPTDVQFTTTEISSDKWENELHNAEKTKTEGEGGDLCCGNSRNVALSGESGDLRDNSKNVALSDKVKLLCGETVCHFQVKRFYYLPEYHTNKDSEQWTKASGMFLRKYSGVDPNWLQL